MGAIMDFVTGPILGDTKAAKDWNDEVTNWKDTKGYYKKGADYINNNSLASQQIQREMLAAALGQKIEVPDAVFAPIEDMARRNTERQLRMMGRYNSSYGMNTLSDLNRKLSMDRYTEGMKRVNANNALYMNAGNQMSQSLDRAGGSLSDLYGKLGNLRYENSAGKHMLSLWGGQ